MIMLLSACSGTDDHPAADAGASIDAVPDASTVETCGNCTHIPLIGGPVTTVTGDGTNIYLVVGNTLQRVEPDGPPVVVATSDPKVGFSSARSGDAVFYAVATDTSYEVHAYAGDTDTAIGTVTSATSIQLDGNATDVYVFGTDAGGAATLWRIPRTGGTSVVVATTTGTPTKLMLGLTRAVISTNAGDWFVDVPGPSTLTSLDLGNDSNLIKLAMAGDYLLTLSEHKETSRADLWTFFSEPGHQQLDQFLQFCGGGYYNYIWDAKAVYNVEAVHVDNTCYKTGSGTYLNSSAKGRLAVWPSMVLGQDATRLFGTEQLPSGDWVIDVLAK